MRYVIVWRGHPSPVRLATRQDADVFASRLRRTGCRDVLVVAVKGPPVHRKPDAVKEDRERSVSVVPLPLAPWRI